VAGGTRSRRKVMDESPVAAWNEDDAGVAVARRHALVECGMDEAEAELAAETLRSVSRRRRDDEALPPAAIRAPPADPRVVEHLCEGSVSVANEQRPRPPLTFGQMHTKGGYLCGEVASALGVCPGGRCS
jgi:hypothetical protein